VAFLEKEISDQTKDFKDQARAISAQLGASNINLQHHKQELSQLKAEKVLSSISFLPSFLCSFSPERAGGEVASSGRDELPQRAISQRLVPEAQREGLQSFILSLSLSLARLYLDISVLSLGDPDAGGGKSHRCPQSSDPRKESSSLPSPPPPPPPPPLLLLLTFASGRIQIREAA
jgi:hypothetical protein